MLAIRSGHKTRVFSTVAPCAGLLAVAALLACGNATDPVGEGGRNPKLNANVFALGSADTPDTQCRVVLRTVARVSDGPGYRTTCSGVSHPTGPCLYLWQGTVDVAQSLATTLSAVEVLYRVGENGAWHVAVAQQTSTGANGFARYSFVLNQDTPADGMSLTSLMRTHIWLIPYVKTAAGGRLFDHNRIADVVASYELTKDNSWAVADDASVCPGAGTPEYVLDYPAFNETLRYGPVRAGEQLVIRYDGRRLRETQSCLGSKGPSSATTIKVGWTANNDYTAIKETGVEAYLESYVSCPSPPCITITDEKPVLTLPANATSLQMWFYCVPGFGSASPYNWKYDSDGGKNYVLPVAPGSLRKVDWAGAWARYNARSSTVLPLDDPFGFAGFTNMGFSFQAEVYVKGLTDQSNPDLNALRAYVESDLNDTCTPGGALTQVALPVAATRAGAYGSNVLYRWGVESILTRCPKGTYRYRFLFSADAGKSLTSLGQGIDSNASTANQYRSIVSK